MIALDLSLSTIRPALSVPIVAPMVSAINADGWSAEWANGTPPAFTPDAAPQTVAIARAGFDSAALPAIHAGTRTFTRRRRNLYPNQASDTAISVALDDYVYATDTIGGVTNNSGEASPKPIAAWMMPGRQLVGNSLHWELIAFHRNFRNNRQVAAVRVRGNDGTTQTTWQIVAVTAISTLCEDANPIEVYAGDLDVSALATGLIWLEAEVYPWIGGGASVLRSEDLFAAGAGDREFTRRYFLKNAMRSATPPLAYVSSAGSDSAGIWSTSATTAAAAPFLTVGGALTAVNDATRGTPATGGVLDGARIRIIDGVAFGSVATARPQNVAAVTIERAPGTTRANAIVTLAATFRPRIGVGMLTTPLTEGALTFSDVTVARTANVTFQGESTNPLGLRFWNVTITNGGTAGTILSNAHAFWFGGVWSGYNANFAGTFEQRLTRGLTIDVAATTFQHWLVIGCSLARAATPSFITPTKGAIWYANRFTSPDATTSPIQIDGAAAGDTITGVIVMQNLIEVTHTTASSAALRISSDNGFAHTAHTIIAHNTIAGYGTVGRSNLFYDENTTDATRRAHRLIRDVGNIYVQLNTKGDVWVGGNQLRPAEAPNRIGQLAYAHGVGCHANWTQFHTASTVFSNEEQTYPGLASKIGAQSAAAQASPAVIWTDYRGTTGSGGTATAGAGGGNYTLQPGAPVRNMVTVRGLAFDLGGAARPSSGTDAAGAYA